jgi:hypothetical protein
MTVKAVVIVASIVVQTTLGHPMIVESNLSNGTISWTACPSTYPSTIDCGNIKVHMDYENLNGPTTELGMVRLKAYDKNPLGNMLFIPSGPEGSAAVQLITQAAAEQANQSVLEFSRKLRAHYNIIAQVHQVLA